MSLSQYQPFAALLVRIIVFFAIVSAFTAVSDWVFPQVEGRASENVLKLLALAGFAISLWISWHAARYAGNALKAEAEA